MTINIETVYNKWLAVTRTIQNKPFKLRKDFSNIENEDFYPHLYKLTNFFKKNPNLFTDDFFIAPFKMIPDTKGYFSLKFYASHKGLVTCSKYFKSIDSKGAEEQIEQVKKSYEFIAKFCKQKGIKLIDYPFYKIGVYPEFLIHLKDHLISFYVIFSFPALYFTITDLSKDDKIIFFGEDFKISEYEKKYKSSDILKNKSAEFYKKVNDFLNK